MFIEIGVVLLLTLLNGVLAMSELAVVSSRPAKLRVMADRGSRGAAAAIRLSEDPGRFLSSVQIGITLVGVLAGAFSGATLGERLSDALIARGFSVTIAEATGVAVVVVAITYLSLIVGELVPKQIALRNPEAVASRIAPAMALVALVAAPVVWFLDVSGKLVLRLLGQGDAAREGVSEEEVRSVIAEAETAGAIKSEEREMLRGVMRLADRVARALMTPRRDVELVDSADAPEEILAQLRTARRSRLPVRDGGSDEIVGIVVVREVLAAEGGGKPFDLRAHVRPAPVVMDGADALIVMRQLRTAASQMALVFDEYGHFEGVITPMDILEAVAGEFSEDSDEEPAIVTRDDGSLLVSGWTPIDEFFERMGIEATGDRDYDTVAGFVIDRLARLPDLGESVVAEGWRFEVVDLDGRRIDKVLVSKAG